MYQEMGPQGPWQPSGRLPESTPSRRNSALPAILITFAIGLGIAFFFSPSGTTPPPPASAVERMCQIASAAQQSQSESDLVGFAEEFRRVALQLPREDVVWLFQGEQVGAALDGYRGLRGDPELSAGTVPALLAAFQNFSTMCGR